MADIEFQLTGLDAVLKKMRALPVDVRLKGARFALRKSANLIRDAAIKNAKGIDDPDTREQIAKNIAVRAGGKRLERVSGDVWYRVGVLGGARQYANTRENRRKRRVGSTYQTDGGSGNPGGDTFYWRYVEFGTQHVQARPFMRPALANNAQAAANEFTTQLNGWLDRYFRKQGIVPPDL